MLQESSFQLIEVRLPQETMALIQKEENKVNIKKLDTPGVET